MKHTDTVMQEVWQAREANAKKHGNLAAYIAYLRKQGIRPEDLKPHLPVNSGKGEWSNCEVPFKAFERFFQ